MTPGIGASAGQLIGDRIDASVKPEEFSWNNRTEALRATEMFGAGVAAGRLLPEEGFPNGEFSLFSETETHMTEPLITPSYLAAQITQPWASGFLLSVDVLSKPPSNGTQPYEGQPHE